MVRLSASPEAPLNVSLPATWWGIWRGWARTPRGISSWPDLIPIFTRMKEQAIKQIVIGLVIAGVGGLITAATYSSASDGGGSYVVAWGAIVFGLFRAARGAVLYLSVKPAGSTPKAKASTSSNWVERLGVNEDAPQHPLPATSNQKLDQATAPLRKCPACWTMNRPEYLECWQCGHSLIPARNDVGFLPSSLPPPPSS